MNFEVVAWDTLDNNYNLQFSGLKVSQKENIIQELKEWNVVADSIGSISGNDHMVVFRKMFADDEQFKMFLETMKYKVNYLK